MLVGPLVFSIDFVRRQDLQLGITRPSIPQKVHTVPFVLFYSVYPRSHSMGIPVILATAAACGSLVTTMKSGWELSRMIRQKRDQKQAEEDAVRVYRSLRRALHSGRMTDKEYDHWFEKFLVAESEKNCEQPPLLCIASVY